MGCTRSSAVFQLTLSSRSAMVPSRTANGSFRWSNASRFNRTFSRRTTPLHRPTRSCSRGRSSTYCPRKRSNSGANNPSNMAAKGARTNARAQPRLTRARARSSSLAGEKVAAPRAAVCAPGSAPVGDSETTEFKPNRVVRRANVRSRRRADHHRRRVARRLVEIFVCSAVGRRDDGARRRRSTSIISTRFRRSTHSPRSAATIFSAMGWYIPRVSWKSFSANSFPPPLHRRTER